MIQYNFIKRRWIAEEGTKQKDKHEDPEEAQSDACGLSSIQENPAY